MSLLSIDTLSTKTETGAWPLDPPASSYLDLAKGLIAGETGVYTLSARGNRAADSEDNAGDILVLKQQNHADEGDLVQAWMPAERRSIVSRIYFRGDEVCLKPEARGAPPRYLARQDVRIQGKVLFIIRKPEARQAA